MKILKQFIFCILILGLIFTPYQVEAKKKSSPYCRAVIYSDSTRVKRMYGKKPYMKVQPASTTKVMTALLVLEKLPLDKYVTVSKRATKAIPTKIHVRQGERYKVRDLLYAILLKSANDASIVLAEAVAGSEWKFVQMMNKRAKKLGARNTKFANSNGLPTKQSQYTTAYDMYLIFRAALKKPFFRQATKLKHKTIYSSAKRKISLKSHNKLLFMGLKKGIYGKTGYTRKAGGCFVGTLQHKGNTHIIAVFGCNSGRWNIIKNTIRKHGGVKL